MQRKYFVGDIYPTNCGINAVIVGSISTGKQLVKVRWLDDYGYEFIVNTTNLGNGKIYNPYAKLMKGIGYVGVGDYSVAVNGVRTLEYATWKGIFQRSYSDAWHQGKPTYKECSVSPDWFCLQDFGCWTKSQVGWGCEGWQIDKDLLFKGNKEYGPETCLMLPRKLNMLIVSRIGGRGELPIGVQWDKERSKYKGQYKEFDGKNRSKRFENPDDAFIYYKTNKERVVKEAAEIYKDQIDHRAYDALMSWEISIND